MALGATFSSLAGSLQFTISSLGKEPGDSENGRFDLSVEQIHRVPCTASVSPSADVIVDIPDDNQSTVRLEIQMRWCGIDQLCKEYGNQIVHLGSIVRDNVLDSQGNGLCYYRRNKQMIKVFAIADDQHLCDIGANAQHQIFCILTEDLTNKFRAAVLAIAFKLGFLEMNDENWSLAPVVQSRNQSAGTSHSTPMDEDYHPKQKKLKTAEQRSLERREGKQKMKKNRTGKVFERYPGERETIEYEQPEQSHQQNLQNCFLDSEFTKTDSSDNSEENKETEVFHPDPSGSSFSVPSGSTPRVDNNCEICGDNPDVFSDGLLLCRSCIGRQIVIRRRVTIAKCSKSGNCLDIGRKCFDCFAKKLEHLNMRPERQQIRPCAVCNSTVQVGCHFGVLSCLRCGQFFGRATANGEHLQFICEGDGQCPITAASLNCKKCHFEKCQQVGMWRK